MENGGEDGATPNSEQDNAPAKSQGDGEPSGKDVVPRTQFIAAINSANERYGRLEAEFKSLKQQLESAAKPPPKQEREWNRAELLALVDEGRMSLAQADSVWEKQLLEKATQRAVEVTTKEVSSREAKRRIDAEIARYKESIPAVMRDGSEERAKVAEEYRNLIGYGMPESVETELAALRSAFGPIDKLKGKSRSQPAVDAEEQTGGADAGDAGGGKGKSNYALVKTLTAREKGYYEKQISSGRYKDWSEVEAELQFANPATRQKMGAKVS